LTQRGLDRALIDRLLDADRPRPEDAVQGAADLARKTLRTLGRFDPPTRKRRLWAMLARRGFDTDTIEAALRSVEDDISQ